MAAAEFPLPDVGEGLTEAEIVQWRVAIGDEIAVDQVLVEIETAKSLVELPSPFAGTVTGLLVSEGDTVEVGKPIIRVDSDASVASGAAAPAWCRRPSRRPSRRSRCRRSRSRRPPAR